MLEDKKSKFIPVPIETMKLEKPKSFDLYVKTRLGKTILYNAKSVLFTAEIRDKVLEKGLSVLYVIDDDIDAYNSYIAENLTDFLSNPAGILSLRIFALWLRWHEPKIERRLS